jgi:polyhydroxyalkanoate synthesis regulator phasin
MIDLLIIGGLSAISAIAKSQTPQAKLQKIQDDFKEGKISPQQAQEQWQGVVGKLQKAEDREPPQRMPLPPHIKEALENGLDYKTLAGKVDPNTYDYLHQAYWYGDWDAGKRKNK